jgi:integrase
MGVLRQILDEAATQAGSQSVGVAVTPLRERRIPIQPFTWEEVERLVDAAPPHLTEYVRVRCLTGLRSGEINGMRWDQVDHPRGVLRVTRARVRGREGLPKNEYSERDIPITAPLSAALQRQGARTASVDGYVFQTPRGRPISTTNFANRDWPAMLAKAGLAPRRPYETRHTAATLMLATGENPAWIAQVLGHADCAMLWATYARYVPNLTRRDGTAFAAWVEGASQ